MAEPTIPFKDVTKLPQKGFYTPPRQRPSTKTGRHTSPEEYSPAYVVESPTQAEIEEQKVRQNLDEKLAALRKKQETGKRSRQDFERGGRKTKKRSKKSLRRKTRKQK
jgi:hypothetical protein